MASISVVECLVSGGSRCIMAVLTMICSVLVRQQRSVVLMMVIFEWRLNQWNSSGFVEVGFARGGLFTYRHRLTVAKNRNTFIL